MFNGGFGDGLYGVLGLGAWTLLQDGVEGCPRVPTDMEHVDGRRKLVGELVDERMSVSHLVGEFAP